MITKPPQQEMSHLRQRSTSMFLNVVLAHIYEADNEVEGSTARAKRRAVLEEREGGTEGVGAG